MRNPAAAIFLGVLVTAVAAVLAASSSLGEGAARYPAGEISATEPQVVQTQAVGPAPQSGAEQTGGSVAGLPGATAAGSIAIGKPWDGALFRGWHLPHQGEDFFTWDFVLHRRPNRGWRRWATDGTIALTLKVLERFRDAHPGAPRIGIGDLSRPEGGDFGPRFGGIGHASHQNGLDVDLYYPRRDERERAPKRVGQIDLGLSQALLNRFVKAGAQFVFVGPSTGLRGRPSIVQQLSNHDNHMHVRFPKRLG